LANYYVKLSTNGTPSLTYDYLRCSKNRYRIHSADTSDLILRFEIKNEFEVFADHTRLGTVHELFLLNPVKCILKLQTQKSNKVIEIDLDCHETKLYNRSYASFFIPVTPREIESLNSWREGESILINWFITGFVLLNKYLVGGNQIPNLALSINNFFADIPVRMGQDEFNENIVAPMGLGEKLIEEFSVEVPNILSTIPADTPAGIKELIPLIVLLQCQLKSALEVFRRAQSIADIRACMSEIRAPLDSVIKLRKERGLQSLGNELFINTGIISDIPGLKSGDAEAAAGDIMNNFWNQFQALANILSKALHTTSTPMTGSKNFQMKPERADARYTLITCLCITNYLIDRVKKALLSL
jgi:hypothetical protein